MSNSNDIDKKIHYRCIMLVIASNENNIYKNARTVWKKYMNINPSVKIFFVYGKLDNQLIDLDSSDIILNDLKESLSNDTILIKTLTAMAIINKSFSYDYFIRTNISTFWNLNIINKLLDKCPKYKCYVGGHNLSPCYINDEYLTTPIYSGVCIVITPDIVTLILNNISNINYTLPDDISIGIFMSNVDYKTFTISDKIYYEDYNIFDKNIINTSIVNNINTCIYYRVKNNSNREHTDLMIYTLLLNRIYNINI